MKNLFLNQLVTIRLTFRTTLIVGLAFVVRKILTNISNQIYFCPDLNSALARALENNKVLESS